MSTCVCVLSNSGERLMPTFRLGKVRRLLKDGKAKIVKHHPFTIQLLYDSKTNTQPIEICEDVGYNYIGISMKSQSHEYVSAQYDTLQDEKGLNQQLAPCLHVRRNPHTPPTNASLRTSAVTSVSLVAKSFGRYLYSIANPVHCEVS